MLIKAGREKEHRMMKFYAAFKGVDLDEEDKQAAQERLNAVKRRANARLRGASEEEIEKASEAGFADFGMEVEELD